LRSLPPHLAQKWLDSLSDDAAEYLPFAWREFWARPEQLMPGTPGASDCREDWDYWLILAGRGFGKTRSGAEAVLEAVNSGQARRIALVGATAGDVRDTMIEGVAGIMKMSPPWNRPMYEPSKRRVTWANGAVATSYSAEEPERLRGPNHDFAWADELAAWAYHETWEQLTMTMREGKKPRIVITTTPKPIKVIRDIMKEPGTVITTGKTRDNLENLAPTVVNTLLRKYEGTRLGRQELDAELLNDIPGALWTIRTLDECRVPHEKVPEMQRIVVAVDPSGTKGAVADQDGKSNDVGIVVCGKGVDGHGYVLEDLTINASPAVWGQRVVDAYNRHKADAVVGETNFGGAMVEYVIRSRAHNVRYKAVVASRGKVLRAEPIAGLYETHAGYPATCHNVGALSALENQMMQMTTEGYLGEGSPDRVDAAVWGLTELMLASRRHPTAQVGTARYTPR